MPALWRDPPIFTGFCCFVGTSHPGNGNNRALDQVIERCKVLATIADDNRNLRILFIP